MTTRLTLMPANMSDTAVVLTQTTLVICNAGKSLLDVKIPVLEISETSSINLYIYIYIKNQKVLIEYKTPQWREFLKIWDFVVVTL